MWTALYCAALALCLLAVWQFGGRRTKGAAGIILCVWLVNFTYARATHDFDNWRLMVAVDFVAAYFTLEPPCNLTRRVVGALYIAQIIFHGVYWSYEWRGLEGPRDAYLSGLYWLASFQLLALMIGALDDRGKRRARLGRVRDGDTVAFATAHARDGIEP